MGCSKKQAKKCKKYKKKYDKQKKEKKKRKLAAKFNKKCPSTCDGFPLGEGTTTTTTTSTIASFPADWEGFYYYYYTGGFRGDVRNKFHGTAWANCDRVSGPSCQSENPSDNCHTTGFPADVCSTARVSFACRQAWG